jgi:enoyl-CoA hydratase
MVTYEVEGRVAVITIRRPEKRNAIDGAAADGLEESFDRLETDPEVWVGVLAGAGGSFCAGADLAMVAAGRSGEMIKPGTGFGGLVTRTRTKPLIAAVDGPAHAGGFELALACDLIVASTTSDFVLPEVKRGMIAGAGGLVRLGRLVPRNVALHHALSGRPMDAATAAHHGLVTLLTEPGEAVAAALALAQEIAANAPIAVRSARRVIVAGAEREDLAWELTADVIRHIRTTNDMQEGPRAFLEKRQPVWTNS